MSSTEAHSNLPDRPVLLLLSDAADLSARVRSHTHDVRTWSARASAAHDEFLGDPVDRSTYEWTRAVRGVTAVIDLAPVDRARAALHALRAVRPDAAVLILSDAAADIDGDRDGTLARGGELRDVVRLDLDEELARLEAERRAHCLRCFAEQADVVPILIHDDPDPDAVSSALAVATLLGGSKERTPIVTLDELRRPENRRMADLLQIRVTHITRDELLHFSHIITVDTQPRGLQQDGRPSFAVIDHHPVADGYTAEFRDIRPEYGATATMMTEYLRAVVPERVQGGLATALLFGIKTDTDSLARGVSPADVAAYAFLQECADLRLIQRFERPSYAVETARAFGSALALAQCDDGLCTAFLGELSDEAAHVMADLGDFCLAIENVTWVVVGAFVEDDLVLTLRHSVGVGPGAGDVAREIAANGGSGGGHATMARVTMPLDAARSLLPASDGEMSTAIHQLAKRTIEQVTEDR